MLEKIYQHDNTYLTDIFTPAASHKLKCERPSEGTRNDCLPRLTADFENAIASTLNVERRRATALIVAEEELYWLSARAQSHFD